MFARKSVLSLVIPFLVSQAVGEVQLDVSDPSRLLRLIKLLSLDTKETDMLQAQSSP
jgi:hypothetical protein